MATKTKKPKLPFIALAMAFMLEKFAPLAQAYKDLNFGKIKGTELSEQITNNSESLNHKASLAMRKILREQVEPNPGYENQYLLFLDQAKKIREEQTGGGFSLEIMGAGTKKEVIESLRFIILTIEQSSIEKLQNDECRFEDDYLSMTTDIQRG